MKINKALLQTITLAIILFVQSTLSIASDMEIWHCPFILTDSQAGTWAATMPLEVTQLAGITRVYKHQSGDVTVMGNGLQEHRFLLNSELRGDMITDQYFMIVHENAFRLMKFIGNHRVRHCGDPIWFLQETLNSVEGISQQCNLWSSTKPEMEQPKRFMSFCNGRIWLMICENYVNVFRLSDRMLNSYINHVHSKCFAVQDQPAPLTLDDAVVKPDPYQEYWENQDTQLPDAPIWL
jgi:hypothetical protein